MARLFLKYLEQVYCSRLTQNYKVSIGRKGWGMHNLGHLGPAHFTKEARPTVSKFYYYSEPARPAKRCQFHLEIITK